MKNIMILVVVLVVLVLAGLLKKDLLENGLWNLIQKYPRVSALQDQNAKLEKELASKVSIRDNTVTITGRDNTGKPIGHKVDVPPEGGTEVITPSTGTPVHPGGLGTEDFGIEGSSSVVRVRIAGFCFRPQISMELDANAQLTPNIDARIAYYKRWGLVAGAYPKPLLSIDRRLDDVIPFLRNTTLGLYKSFSPSGYGIRLAVFL